MRSSDFLKVFLQFILLCKALPPLHERNKYKLIAYLINLFLDINIKIQFVSFFFSPFFFAEIFFRGIIIIIITFLLLPSSSFLRMKFQSQLKKDWKNPATFKIYVLLTHTHKYIYIHSEIFIVHWRGDRKIQMFFDLKLNS